MFIYYKKSMKNIKYTVKAKCNKKKQKISAIEWAYNGKC